MEMVNVDSDMQLGRIRPATRRGDDAPCEAAPDGAFEGGILRTADLAIAGWGFLPAILALQLRALQPDLRILLLSGDQELPGLGLELVMPARLPGIVAEVIEPCVVAQWRSLLVSRGGRTVAVEEPVALLDALQLRLELMAQFAPEDLITEREELDWYGGILTWLDGRARLGDFIDLRALTSAAGATDIIEADALSALELPALSDFTDEDDAWLCLRHVPIGEGRVAVSRVPRDAAGWIPQAISGLPGPDYYELLSLIAGG